MKQRLALLLGAAVTCTPLMARESASPTLREARTQTAEELANRLLGASARLVSEVERPSDDPRYFDHLEFASAPRSSGFEGVCEAETFWVGLRKRNGLERAQNDTPTYVESLSTAKTFRIVAEPTDIASRRDPDWKTLERQCEEQRPVFAEERRFFTGMFKSRELKSVDAYFAARTVALAILAARDPSFRPECLPDTVSPTNDPCADPRATVARLDLSRLIVAAIEPCADLPETLCVDASFPMGETPAGDEQRVHVYIRTDSEKTDPPPDRIRLRDVSLAADTLGMH
jgi:hypothetical protein